MSDAIDRIVKGGRSAFFQDPDVDRLLCMLTRLMAHHWALYERVQTLEELLAANDLLPAGAVDRHVHDAETDGRLDGESHAFIKDVMEAARNIQNKQHKP